MVGKEFEAHLASYFEGHSQMERVLGRGPIEHRLRGYHTHVIAPGPRAAHWSVVTCGASEVLVGEGHRAEFILASPDDSERWVELATMLAYYHAGPSTQRLAVGHTVPIGEPIVPGSRCDYHLISRPYPYGPDLERCPLADGSHIQVLWALPITQAEKRLVTSEGVEALESRLEAAAIRFADLFRASAVPDTYDG